MLKRLTDSVLAVAAAYSLVAAMIYVRGPSQGGLLTLYGLAGCCWVLLPYSLLAVANRWAGGHVLRWVVGVMAIVVAVMAFGIFRACYGREFPKDDLYPIVVFFGPMYQSCGAAALLMIVGIRRWAARRERARSPKNATAAPR